MSTTQLLVLLLALITLLTVLVQKREAFGTSPGTMTQLATSHVLTVEDIPMLQQWVRDRDEGIKQMTESDLRAGFPMEYQILGSRIGAFA
jgi:hypothetical protein